MKCCLPCPCTEVNFPDSHSRIKAIHFHRYVMSSYDDPTNIENVFNICGVLQDKINQMICNQEGLFGSCPRESSRDISLFRKRQAVDGLKDFGIMLDIDRIYLAPPFSM